MKIASADINLSAQHRSVELHKRAEQLRIRFPTGRGDTGRAAADRVELSVEGRRRLESLARSEGVNCKQTVDEQDLMPVKLFVLKLVVEKLTGREITVPRLEARATETEAIGEKNAEFSLAGFRLEYDRHELHYEAESTTFEASGVITTEDGTEIRFDLSLAMSREFLREQRSSLRIGEPEKKDPLVINFTLRATELTQTRFEFDLEGNGELVLIPFVAPHSGLLAIDSNSDGKINDGTELFGPRTGDGFAELAVYDDDNNGWIDENDSMFGRLVIWTRDENGNDVLESLADRGIGAISLNRVATPFQLRDADNASLGEVRSTGVYLGEDGTVRTMQQVDLTVE